MTTLPGDLASSITYVPTLKVGPRFHVPADRCKELDPYLKGLVRAHPHVQVVAGVGDGDFVGLSAGLVFGPENDVALDHVIAEKFGVKVPEKGPDTTEFENPYTVQEGIEPQPPLQKPTGRGRPPKYPFRQMTRVGDHFLAVGASRPKMQATGCNFLTKSGLRGTFEFEYVRVKRGVLVILVESPDDTSRYEADASEEDR